MMEEADMCDGNGDPVFVTGLDHIVIADGAAGLGNVGNAALVGALDVVPEGEEGIGTEGNSLGCLQPFLFFLAGEDGRLFREDPLPVICPEEIHALVGDVDINGVVPVRTAHILAEGQGKDLRALAEIPYIRLVSRKARAVDAGLLSHSRRSWTGCTSR